MRPFLALRAYPTLLRIGLAEAIAYRAEMIVWMLSTTMPLVNLALWHAVAADGPIAGFHQADITAYFLAALVVRQFTSSWVVWEMNQEMRSGTFSLRLLRPVHPLLGYSAENLAAMPLRGLLSVPIAIVALLVGSAGHAARDPLLWAIAAAAIVGAWLITFSISAIIGVIGFFSEQSLSIFDVYVASFFALSGYLFPLHFLSENAPRALRALHALPFYYQNGFPVEVLLGQHDRAAALAGLGVTWAYALGLLLFALAFWRVGVRRWNAYGA